MAHYAELSEDNVVLRVIVVSNDIADGEIDSAASYCSELFGGHWIQTSYNSNFRKSFAATGMLYDEGKDMFVLPKPKPWYVLTDQGQWASPVGIHPDTGAELEDWQWRWLEAVFAIQIDWGNIDWATNVG